MAAGRTDSGVHAVAQVVHASFATRLPPPVLVRALNALLPRDLAVRGVAAAEEEFHARYSARSKAYVYRLWNGSTRSPLRERDSVWIAQSLDLLALRHAAALCTGTRDFSSFRAAGAAPGNAIRTLYRVALCGAPGAELRIEVEGSGFLRHMVRNLVGTLLEVGRRRRSPESIPALLAARDRRLAGPSAPPRGLTLARIDYPRALRWEAPG